MRSTPTCALILLALFAAPISHAQNAATPVFVVEAKLTPIVDEIESLGTLRARENVALTSSVTELVTKVNFTDGQRVKQGDVLVEMDAAEEQALLAEEESRVSEAQRQVKRLEPLVKRKQASVSDLDTQKLQLQTAEARLKAIESRIRQRKIVAPFDGVLGLRNISVGALSQPGTQITTIDSDAEMKLDFAVPELFISALKPGVKIDARTSAWPDDVFRGTIASVDSRIDQITRSITVRAILPNPDFKLRPGLLMRVTLKKDPREAIVIPEEALEIRGQQQSVLIAVNDGNKTLAEKREVQIGQRLKGNAEILQGLNPGDKVITHGNLRARPGGEVAIKAEEKNDETLQELLKQANRQGAN